MAIIIVTKSSTFSATQIKSDTQTLTQTHILDSICFSELLPLSYLSAYSLTWEAGVSANCYLSDTGCSAVYRVGRILLKPLPDRKSTRLNSSHL